MEIVSLTLPAVREAMKAVVAERGEDYDYKAHHSACRYTQWVEPAEGPATQVPGCLVGAVLNRLGVPLTEMDHWNDSAADDLLHNLREVDDIDYADAEAAEWVGVYLGVAQEVQDHGGSGHTWGDALRVAEERIAGALA